MSYWGKCQRDLNYPSPNRYHNHGSNDWKLRMRVGHLCGSEGKRNLTLSFYKKDHLVRKEKKGGRI
jgi:hypothetical protein